MSKKIVSEISEKIEQIIEIAQSIQDVVDELEDSDISDITSQWISDLEEYLDSEDDISINTVISLVKEQ